jgi:hypothetical protein
VDFLALSLVQTASILLFCMITWLACYYMSTAHVSSSVLWARDGAARSGEAGGTNIMPRSSGLCCKPVWHC